MANFDWTSESDFKNEIENRFMYSGERRPVHCMFRQKQRARSGSGFGLLGFQKSLAMPFAPIKYREHMRVPTIPQFSGKVSPAGVREVALCKYDSATVSPVVMETLAADVNGDFQCYGWHNVEASGKYFYRISGDNNYSTKDFPVLPPVANEYKHPYPNGTMADTALEPQQQYVEDSFTDTQGTSISVHTPILDDVGTGWAVTSAGDIVCGNHADGNPSRFVAYTVSGSTQTGVIDAGDADVVIMCHFVYGDTAIQPHQHGLILRYTDTNNYLRVVVENAETTNPRFSVISKVAGVDTVLHTIDFPEGTGPFVTDKYYEMRVVAYGATVAVDFYNYNWQGKGTSAYASCFRWHSKAVTDHQAATKHGLYIGGDQMYADEFQILSI